MTLPDAAELAWLATHAARSVVNAVVPGAITAAMSRKGNEIPVGLRADGASFVTLRQAGQLRGCIGTLEARRALHDDVADNARGAALRDPRFPPLAADEIDATAVEVSVLSAPSALPCHDRGSLLDALRPGIDGVVVRHGLTRATLLPAVWTSLPDPARFIDALLAKAGIDAATPFTALAFERYRTISSPQLALASAVRD